MGGACGKPSSAASNPAADLSASAYATPLNASPMPVTADCSSHNRCSSAQTMLQNGSYVPEVEVPVSQSSIAPRKKRQSLHVYVDVYHLKQATAAGRAASFIRHSALEFLGVNYSFAKGTGILKGCDHRAVWDFVETIKMGKATVRALDVGELMRKVNEAYSKDSYHCLTHNCNTFVSDMCLALVGKPAPAWINQPAVNVSSLLHLSYFCPTPPTFDDLSLLPQPSPEPSEALAVAAAAAVAAVAAIPTPPSLAPCPSTDTLPASYTPPPVVLASDNSSTAAATCLQTSPSVLTSPSIFPLIINLPQDTTATAVDTTLPSPVPLPCTPQPTTPEPTTPEMASPAQQAAPPPEILFEAAPTPPPQPSASSATPETTPAKWHRPECLKCVVPKGFGQSIKSFFCCGGRAGMVKGEA